MKKSITLALLLSLFGCSKEEAPRATISTPEIAAVAQKEKIKAGQIIQFTKPQFACQTKEKYDEASLHGYRKEKTKFRAMFNRHDCISISPSIDFKVLRVVDSYTDFNIIEITIPNTADANGLFTEWDYPK